MKRTELADCVIDMVERSEGVFVYSDEAKNTIAACRDRFLGVGADQYQISEDEQSFERSSLGTMLKGLREELQDIVNYAVMCDILLDRQDGYEDAEHLRVDLQLIVADAVDYDVMMQRRLAAMVESGAWQDDGEDYVHQLDAECDAVESSGASGRGHAEIEARYNGTRAADDGAPPHTFEVDEYPYNGRDADGCPRPYPTPETPDGLDAIEDEFEAA